MPRIERMFAFIVTNLDEDDEGIPAVKGSMGWMPLVGADMARVDMLLPMAESLANEMGKTLTLVEFSVRRVMQKITPQGKH